MSHWFCGACGFLDLGASVTAAMSLRLSAALGTSPDFWLKMQMQRDLWLGAEVRLAEISPVFRRRAPRGAIACLTR